MAQGNIYPQLRVLNSFQSAWPHFHHRPTLVRPMQGIGEVTRSIVGTGSKESGGKQVYAYRDNLDTHTKLDPGFPRFYFKE